MSGNMLRIVKTVSSAGSWQDAQDKALWAPAANVLGINYALDTSQSWADALAQVETNSVTWDIIQIALAEIPQAKAAGALEKLDSDVYSESDFVPGSCTDFFVANSLYSTVLAWNKSTYGTSSPNTKADFWDIKKFPGKRALWNEPVGMLEAAVLAMGTPRDKVYVFLSSEEGRRAAINKLAEISSHVSVWWESGDEASLLMKNSEVDMILTWGGRVQGVIDAGANFAYTFNDGQLGTDGYAVVKGAPNRDLAMRFLNEISKPQYQRDLSNCFPTAPVNMKAFDIAGYTPEKIATMASAPQNVDVQYTVDPDFWAQHGDWAYSEYAKIIKKC